MTIKAYVLALALSTVALIPGAGHAESPLKGAGRIIDQGVTNWRHGPGRVVDYYAQDRCDDACEARQRQSAGGRFSGGGRFQAAPVEHYASAEVDCYKPGRSDRWGTVQVRRWSQLSSYDARQAVLDEINRGDVCQAGFRDRNLYDGSAHWLT
jgi:hypothetical protein